MLVLGEAAISFEPSSSLSEIFFDNVNCKICTVRGNGAMGVTVKGLDPTLPSISFRIKDLGKIKTVKLSPSSRIASVQRNDNSVDFILLDGTDGNHCLEFTQLVKMRNGVIRQVEWVTSNQIIFVTNHGLELYQVFEDKKYSKLLKTVNVASDWSTYFSPSRLLLLATGVNSSTIQPFVVHHGQINRLAKFQVDFGCSNSKSKLLERDVTVASIYGSLYVIALRYSLRDSSATDLLLYKLSSDVSMPAALKYSLILGLTGMFGIHVIDNMVIVHHQLSSRSLIFDIGLDPSKQSHTPMAEVSMSISDHLLSVAGQSPSLYTPSWVVFSPNVVIDPHLGLFSALSLKAHQSPIEDTMTRIRFLMNRSSQKSAVLKEFEECIRTKSLCLRSIQQILDVLVEKYCVGKIPVLRPSDSSRQQLIFEDVQLLSVEQGEMQNMFVALKEDSITDKVHLSRVMLLYLSTLHTHNITVEPYLLDILVNTLVVAGQLSKLHQLLSYNVINDSKPMAYLLLSLETKYPPLFQSGVDMLSREGATDEIVEVLLDKGHVIEALRYVESVSSVDRHNCLKALDCAWSRGQRVQQYAVYSECAEKKGKQVWTEQFDRFTKEFKHLYDESEISTADREVALSILCE